MDRCAVVQNRMIALPDRAAPPADVASHVAGCPRCAAYATRLDRLDAELVALPAPSSEDRKLAFLDALSAAGPVIRSVPAVPARGTRLRDLLAGVGWRPVGGLAAAVAVGLGLWAAVPGPRAPVAEVAPPRHELLKRVVTIDAELARLRTPSERIPKLTELTAALHAETEGVYRAARRNDEMRSLSKMYRAVIREGIVEQAKQYREFEAAERKAVLTRAAAKLAAEAARTTELKNAAPKEAKDSLDEMYQAADAARAELTKLAGA